MPQKKKNVLMLIISAMLIISSAGYVFSQDGINTETSMSWLTGDIIISATAHIPISTSNITSERFRIAEAIDRGLTAVVTEAFDGIYLDSLYSLKDGFTSNGRMMAEFDSLNLRKTRVSSSLSLDLDKVTNIYKYNIYDELIPILTAHTRTAPPPVLLNYEPTATFSGIIIYAADSMPFYGESERGYLNPAIFPKIFTEKMELVASARMASPDFLKKWGFILYTDSFDEKQIEERIGLYPFRTTAQAIFGNNHTDILITDTAARKILYNEANRRLIEEGRIVVIINGD